MTLDGTYTRQVPINLDSNGRVSLNFPAPPAVSTATAQRIGPNVLSAVYESDTRELVIQANNLNPAGLPGVKARFWIEPAGGTAALTNPDRPMTAAHKALKDEVPHAEKKRRWKTLEDLINQGNLKAGTYAYESTHHRRPHGDR